MDPAHRMHPTPKGYRLRHPRRGTKFGPAQGPDDTRPGGYPRPSSWLCEADSYRSLMPRRSAIPSAATAAKPLRFRSLDHPHAPDGDVVRRSSGSLYPASAYRRRSPVASSVTAPTVIADSRSRIAPTPERDLEHPRVGNGDDLEAAEGLQALAVRRPAPAPTKTFKATVKSEIGGSSSFARLPRKGSHFFDGLTFSLKMSSNGNKPFRCITVSTGLFRRLSAYAHICSDVAAK